MLNTRVKSNLAEFRGGDKYLCKLGKEYLNASVCKFVIYSLQHSETFDVSHVFLTLTITELPMLKQVRFFGPSSIMLKAKTETEAMVLSLRPKFWPQNQFGPQDSTSLTVTAMTS